MLRERAKKFEEKSRLYAGLAHVMRRDGLWMITLVRWSYLPGHLVTCIQSTIGISVWIFGIACAISLPKQLALVYLGVLFGDTHKLDNQGKSESQIREEAESNTRHKVVSWTVLCITGFLSVVAMYIIWFRMWQEGKRIAALALAPSTTSSIQSESKEELGQLENGGQYTLPYMDFPSSDALNRDRSSSHASTSTSPPTIHSVSGRPKHGRSRSSTHTSLMASNNSLPYLPYTPMLDVDTPGFQAQNRNSPSPVPSAMVGLPPAVLEGESDPFMGDYEMPSSRSQSPYGPSQSTNSASMSASSDINMRPKHVRLARSTSNVVLTAASGASLASDPLLESGTSSEEDSRTVQRVSSQSGRHQARSRVPSNLGPGRGDASEEVVNMSRSKERRPCEERDSISMDTIMDSASNGRM
jgi:hypothetical protein